MLQADRSSYTHLALSFWQQLRPLRDELLKLDLQNLNWMQAEQRTLFPTTGEHFFEPAYIARVFGIDR
ncbi:MAG TPA: hypothetical protein VJ731_17005 [Terriglobales bacterium]|nr:hypothetical protein [Terriglobales bacterium]